MTTTPMSKERTLQDVLDAINVFATSVEGRLGHLEGRFDKLEGRFDKLEKRFDGLEKRFDGLEKRFDKLEGRFDRFEKVVVDRFKQIDDRFDRMGRIMATKEQVDRLHEQLVLLSRKTNTKLTVLIEDLESRRVIDPATAKRILALEPFPQA